MAIGTKITYPGYFYVSPGDICATCKRVMHVGEKCFILSAAGEDEDVYCNVDCAVKAPRG